MKKTILLTPFGVVLTASTDVFEPRCGNCWCVSYPEEECPIWTEGLTMGFSQSLVDALSSHVLVSNPSELPRFLATSDDGNTTTDQCFPFPEVDNLRGMPEASWEACDLPTTICSEEAEDQVCAFRYVSDGVRADDGTCHQREYEMIPYASAECAEADGAVVTHTGKCGVCSSAQDLAVMGGTVDTLMRDSLICSFLYYSNFLAGDLSEGSKKLRQCFEKLGYTKPCAFLWAMTSAVSALRCTDVCLEESQGNLNPKVVGPPPVCAREPCWQCAEDFTTEQTLEFAGRSYANSGIVAEIPANCTTFSRIVYDTCAPTAPNSTQGGADTDCRCSLPNGTVLGATSGGFSVGRRGFVGILLSAMMSWNFLF